MRRALTTNRLDGTAPSRPTGRNAVRRPRRWWLRGLLALTVWTSAVAAQPDARPAPSTVGVHRLVVEHVEVEGNTRTPAADLERVAGLRSGDTASPDAIFQAVSRLEESGLVREASAHTRRGSQAGQVVVVFSVQERRPEVRLGLGFQNLAGWYLIPVQLNLDNITGHHERFDLGMRFGFRLIGLVSRYRRPSLDDPRHFWEIGAQVESLDRLYYFQGTEVRQNVGRGGLDFRLGRPISRHWSWDGWVTMETFNADSTAEIGATRETQGLEEGDEIPYDALPPGVQSGVGRRQQTRLGLALGLDSRRGRSFTTRGFWGRTQGEAVFSKDGGFPRGEVDLRGYLTPGRHIQLATRVRAAAVGDNAPFYQRFYLGGLYTVRGYPNQSLSPPGGNTRAAYASIELRTLWVGRGSDPLLVGFAFLDAGIGWDRGAPELDTGAASIGYGVSVGLPWIDRLGLHVGFPLSPSPVNEAFHLNLSIGWTY